MTNTNAENFAEIMNRIARVPASSVPPRKPKQTSEQKPAPENNKPSPEPAKNNEN